MLNMNHDERAGTNIYDWSILGGRGADVRYLRDSQEFLAVAN